jgi:tetratricopeptide (TPR) repeat protein
VNRRIYKPLCIALALSAAPLAWGAGTGSASPPAGGAAMSKAETQDPAALALRLYNEGVKLVQRADEAGTDAKRAQKDYASALKKFESAVEGNPLLAEGWNYVGYCRRQTGDYGGALGAYDEALRLKAGFPEALEYRGHAYLGLNRVDDAKRDYLDLFGRNRALAAKLLAAIRTWSGAQRAGSNANAEQLNSLDAWITEREKLAQQTAALSRAGSAAGWN